MLYVFDQQGRCLERNGLDVAPPLAAFVANHGPDIVLWPQEADPYPLVPLEMLTATISQGQVVEVTVDPAWQPPAPPAPDTSVQDSLADILARVDAIPVSDHSRRNEDQKEFIKTFGIPWVKANPEATPEEAVAAILEALRAEFPADPIVSLIYAKDEATGREDGLLMSYAKSAVKLGLIAEPTWQALRALVVDASKQLLREALRKL
ncbi:MAG: hypothetical protein V1806_03795 [Pseudomonadota bacterium]